MLGKKQAVKWTVIFFAVVLLCSFSSKTIYYFTLPKVSIDRPKSDTFTEVAALSQGTLEIKGAASCNLDLPTALTVDEVFVTKGDTIEVGDEILRFSMDDIKKKMTALEKQRESAEIALKEFMQSFNSRIKALREQMPSGVSGSEINIQSASGGLVTSLNVKKGDRVVSGMKLCEIADDSRLIVRLPFSTAFNIKPGMQSEVSIPSEMVTLSGTVKEIGGQITLNGAKARMVTIEIADHGSIIAGEGVSAEIDGGLTPMENGELEYLNTTSLYAEAAGYISSLNVSLYESVTAGKTLMQIELPETDSAKEELVYMLSTGIYNGRTENQLRDALDEANAALGRLADIGETGVVTAEGDGIISDLTAQKGMSFFGGTLYEYAPVDSKYQVELASGNMSEVRTGQKCAIYYDNGGRQVKVNGTVADVGIGNVTVESILLGSSATQAQSFSVEVVLFEYNAPMTVPLSAMVGANSIYIITTNSSVLGEQYVISRREVTTGQSDERNIEILGGITKEDKVIVSWDRALTDGAVVDIVAGK